MLQSYYMVHKKIFKSLTWLSFWVGSGSRPDKYRKSAGSKCCGYTRMLMIHCPLKGKELLPVAVPMLGLLQCRGILHTQQQAAQQHLGVRRLHFHLKAKTTFRTCFKTVPRRVAGLISPGSGSRTNKNI